MPNYNHNWLEIAGPPPLAAEVVAALGPREPKDSEPVMDGEGLLDFERILPIPEQWRDTDDESDWTVPNWGTPSGAWEVSRRHIPGRATAFYYFVTAYTPPLPLLDHIAQRWPELKMHLDDVSFDDMEGGSGSWEKGERVSYETVRAEFEEITTFFIDRGSTGIAQWMKRYWLGETQESG